jgi:hypothetical protein
MPGLTIRYDWHVCYQEKIVIEKGELAGIGAKQQYLGLLQGSI